MARRKRVDPDSTPEDLSPDSDEGSVSSPTLPPPEPQATLTMRGPVSQVKRNLGGESSRKSGSDSGGNGTPRERLADALRDPKNVYYIKRQKPKELDDGTPCDGKILSEECPATYEEILEEVEKDWGGFKYRLSILNRETREEVAVDTFEIQKPPKIKPTREQQLKDDLIEEVPLSEADKSLEEIEHTTKLADATYRLEQKQHMLRELRESTTGKSKEDPRIAQLEREVAASREEIRAARLEDRHRAEIAELKKQIQELNERRQTSGKSDIAVLAEQMAADRKEFRDTITQLINKDRDDKLERLIQTVEKGGSKTKGDVREMVESVTLIAQAFGIKTRNLLDEDEDDDRGPREWWERLAEKAPDLIDKFIDRFTKGGAEGKSVNREDILRAAKEAEDEAVRRGIMEVRSRTTAALPAPKPAPAALPPAPTSGGAGSPPAHAPSIPPLPPPPPGSTPAAPPSLKLVPKEPAQEAVPEVPGALPTMTMAEQYTLKKVASWLDTFATEVDARPKMQDWTYECWDTIPEDLLEKICQAKSGDELVDILSAISHMKQEPMLLLRQKVNASPKTQAFVKRGLDELATWWAKSLENPNFDPSEIEEEEEEAEPA